MNKFHQTILLLLTCATLAAADQNPPAKYKDAATKLIQAATDSRKGWDRLAYFCDYFPARLSGSTNLERGIDWMVEQLKQDGFENVHTEEVMVPHWVRGNESAIALAPIQYKLHMLGLGGSISTPPEGITAEVLVVRDFDELEKRSSEAKGKILLFNTAFTTYGETVKIRSQGAIRAARAGAVASLIRSVTPYSMRTPHTGGMRYEEGGRQIPHAAITPEDADWLARMQARGEKVIVQLKMEAHTLPLAKSRNIIADLPGTEQPNDFFLLSAHLDSWDVGQGAMDDGGGCLAVWEAIRLIKDSKLRPRRSLRLVLYTNEENGVAGARAFARAHADDFQHYYMAFETDEGVFQPKGFKYSGPETDRPFLESIASLLEPIGANKLDPEAESTDLIFLAEKHVPTLNLVVDGTKYFWFHHSDADTLDKLNVEEFNRCVGAIAVMAYSFAEHNSARTTDTRANAKP